MKKINKLKAVITGAVVTGLVCFAVVGCAPETKSQDEANADKQEQEQIQSFWSIDMECGTCHADKKATTEDASLTACTHVTEAQTTCITCHDDEAALSEVHVGATASGPMPTKLKKTTVEVETCQSAGCHDLPAADFQALTAHVDTLVDVEGTKANPHEVMTLTPGHVDITCLDCHSEHGEDYDEAMTCVSCHHMGKYECNTCHEAG